MGQALVGITDRSDRYPARGERIALWLDRYMRDTGLSVGEVAFKIKADKRDVRRLLSDRSCGPRLNDALEEAFGWDFIEQVATPVVGADPMTARERELERRLADAAALHARVEREHAIRKGGAPSAALRVVELRAAELPGSPLGRGA